AVEALLQRSGEPAHDDGMTARAPGHHHDAAPGELIAPLVYLHPREELGFAHAQIELDIHCCLTVCQCSNRKRWKKGPDLRSASSPPASRGKPARAVCALPFPLPPIPSSEPRQHL